MKNVIKRKITRIITHKDLRFAVYLRWSILLSMLTALFKVTAGLLTDSSWFLFAGLYYSILCVARIFLAHENKELKKKKYKNERFLRSFRDYRYTGFILMVLTLPYLLMCVRMFRYGEFEEYVIFLLTASAIIALIKLLLSCIGFYNTMDLHSPIISAVKRINLCDALVSIAITQAMLSAFFCDGRFTPFSLFCGVSTAVISFALGYMMFNRHPKARRK